MDVGRLTARVDALIAEQEFSGVVRVDVGDDPVLERAAGWSHRAHDVVMTLDTRLGVASGAKAFTALTVLSLHQDGTLPLGTSVRPLLGADLPEIDDAVTVELLLAHRSGIGDYLDESAGHAIDAYVMTRPLHTLADGAGYLPALADRPRAFVPGERFAYCNSGFVLLAILAERASGVPFPELVAQRVCAPAGLVDTAYLRSDDLPGRTALGYLARSGDRTNVLHLPVRGSGDGGLYSTVDDVHRLWRAVDAGAVVDPAIRALAWAPRSDVPAERSRHGLGFWLAATGPRVIIEGYDAGVSCRSVHDPSTRVTHTVIANWTDGAWPLTRALDQELFPPG